MHGPEDFRSFDASASAKAAMNFSIESDADGNTVILWTETRIYIPNRGARRHFALYWRAIHPGSALIRRMWLRGVKRRAEH
jgi:hypothetical protein